MADLSGQLSANIRIQRLPQVYVIAGIRSLAPTAIRMQQRAALLFVVHHQGALAAVFRVH